MCGTGRHSSTGRRNNTGRSSDRHSNSGRKTRPLRSITTGTRTNQDPNRRRRLGMKLTDRTVTLARCNALKDKSPGPFILIWKTGGKARPSAGGGR